MLRLTGMRRQLVGLVLFGVIPFAVFVFLNRTSGDSWGRALAIAALAIGAGVVGGAIFF